MFSVFRMSFEDLSMIYKKFSIWKDDRQKTIDSKRTLEKELNDLTKLKFEAERVIKNLQNENTSLNQEITNLKQTVVQLSDLEVTNNNLLTDIEQLKLELEQSSRLNGEDKSNFEKEVLSLQEKHDQKLQKIQEDMEVEREKQLEVILVKLKEKDKKICELESERKDGEMKMREELFKLKFQYEEKIKKLQRQASIDKLSAAMPQQNADIFRKKSLKLEQEYKEQIEALRSEIDHLKLKNANPLIAATMCSSSLSFDVDFTKEINNDRSLATPLAQNFSKSSAAVRTITTTGKNVAQNSTSGTTTEDSSHPSSDNKSSSSEKSKNVNYKAPLKRRKLFNHDSVPLFEI